MSTRGGDVFFVKGVMSLANVPASDIKVIIGGRECTGITKTEDGDLGPQYGVPAGSPLASQYLTFEVACLTPAGVGKDLPILISVPGGISQDNPNFKFTYSAPNVSSIVLTSELGKPLAYTASGSLALHGIPTLGALVRVRGTAFGTAALVSALPVPQRLTATVFHALSGRRVQATVVSHDHEEIVILFPPGQGKDVTLIVAIAGQSDTDPVAGSPPRAASLVRYRNPVIESVVHPVSSGQGGPTLGGPPLYLFGSDFGAGLVTGSLEDGKPLVTIGGRPAELVPAYLAVVDHSRLEVLLPEGWGRDLPVVVTVAGQASTVSKYTYAPPRILSLTPVEGPTSGKRASGSIINMTLVGTNLGRVGSVLLRPSIINETAVPVLVPHEAMHVHNHTHMMFPTPEGAGADLEVVADVGGQASDTVSSPIVLFSYDRPLITRILNAERTEAECRPRPLIFRPDNLTTVTKMQYPGCYPTLSDPPFVLRITGESFGAPAMPMRVTVGGKSCEVLRHDHNEALCVAPAGMGDAVAVVLTVGGRPNIPTPSSIFSYDPPVITAIMPNRPDAALGQGVDIRGANFGPSSAPLQIAIGGKECLNALWMNDGLLRCTTQPDSVGRKNMTIGAANRTAVSTWYESEGVLEYRCKRGFYGLQGEACVECGSDDGMERGARCPGEELDHDLVLSLPGWWRFNVSEPSLCHPLRVHRTLDTARFSGGCLSMAACEPPESCLGANICAPAYQGDRCALCARGFYRVSGECVKCPDSPWAVVIVFATGALAALAGAYFLNSKNISLALVSIGMDWAQVVAMFARTRIRWPALVKQLFLILSAFNFNLELIAPECAIPEVTFSGKWLFVEALPIFGWLILVAIFGCRLAWKCFVLQRRKNTLYSHLPVLIATGTVVQRVLYLYVTRTTLDIFNCSPTDPPEYDRTGKEVLYMAWNLDIRCNEPGGSHLFLLPFAVAALAVYVVGLPVLAFCFLRKNKDRVKYDQILRAQMVGDDRLSNPFYEFRKSWKALYMNYRPGTWYWEVVICVRKFLIAFCSLMFRRTPSYQLAMALLVLFVAYVLQVRSRPYLSHSTADTVMADHHKKVMSGDSMHCTIEHQMRALASANGRARGKVGLSGDGGVAERFSSGGRNTVTSFFASRRTTLQWAVLNGREAVLKNKVASVLFDYNTAEAILLASAILVSLAGICFDSSRFSGDSGKRKEVQAEYDSLTFALLTVVFVSICYWAISLITDIALVAAPGSVAKCISSASSSLKTVATTLKASGSGGPFKLQASAKTGNNPGKSAADEEASAPEMVTNPAMLQMAMAGSTGGARAAGQMAAWDISDMNDVPDPHTWAMVKSSYQAMADKSKAVQSENERLRFALNGSGVDAERLTGGAAVAQRSGALGMYKTRVGTSSLNSPEKDDGDSVGLSPSGSRTGGRVAFGPEALRSSMRASKSSTASTAPPPPAGASFASLRKDTSKAARQAGGTLNPLQHSALPPPPGTAPPLTSGVGVASDAAVSGAAAVDLVAGTPLLPDMPRGSTGEGR